MTDRLEAIVVAVTLVTLAMICSIARLCLRLLLVAFVAAFVFAQA